jgi:hypothetical protein
LGLKNVTVHVRGIDRVFEKRVFTNADGYALVADLEAGAYSISVIARKGGPVERTMVFDPTKGLGISIGYPWPPGYPEFWALLAIGGADGKPPSQVEVMADSGEGAFEGFEPGRCYEVMAKPTKSQMSEWADWIEQHETFLARGTDGVRPIPCKEMDAATGRRER